jgi:hypothetical protein
VRPLIEHWDGRRWRKVGYELPYGNTLGQLTGVVAVSHGEAWAVGNTYGAIDSPLLLHWTCDAGWKPDLSILGLASETHILKAVDAVSADDVWTVGAGRRGTSTLHWDGATWRRVKSPRSDWLIDEFFGVAAIASNDVWAVGGYGADSDPDRVRVAHWDGEQWRKVHAPNPGSEDNRLWAVGGSGPNDVWAVGSFSDGGDDVRRLYLHWDGDRWSRVRPGGRGAG